MAVENTHYGAARIGELLKDCKSIFFIGVGGISMSSLARATVQSGFRVGGSDRTESALTQALVQDGVSVFYGHDGARMEEYDAAVYTVAIDSANPEYLAAQRLGKPLISRSDYLGYLMTCYRHRIGIAGMHGKSTCTSMCAQIFAAASDPTVFCGAAMPGLGNLPCVIGHHREHFVFEACEYMDSFLDFNPTLAVVLNIGLDHVDYFQGMEQIRSSFLRYASLVGEGGTLLYNADDEECRRTFASFCGQAVSFGLHSEADFTARQIFYTREGISFDLYRGQDCICRLSLRAMGEHNVYNALAASAAALLCGLSDKEISQGLSAFRGAARRMEFKGYCNGAVVFDDYAHHPDEIRATLSGIRRQGYQRILCAYQPHTYSRTAGLLKEFCEAFSDADLTFFADIYAAREENVYGVTSATIVQGIGASAHYCGSFDAVAAALRAEARQGDAVVIMGAGDIFHVFDLLGLSSSDQP